MSNLRWILIASVGWIAAGCNGCESCESCSGTSGAAPDASAVTEPVAAPAARDAARVDAEMERASETSDAGGSGRKDAGVEVLAASNAPPRPPAPMAKGAFQSCGVYDGPVCQKDCNEGNCRQECDGVTCLVTCKGGYCSQKCGASGKCTLACGGGHCVQVCDNPDTCTKTCTGGDCS